MCGSYRICFKDTKIGKSILDKAKELNIENFAIEDVYPSNNVLTIVPKMDKISLSVKKWGIPISKKLLINARSETLDEKVFFQDIKNKRCIIPVSSFYEWKDSKRYSVKKKDNELFYLAGIYNNNNELLILTGESSNDLKEYHSRSPIIFNKSEMLKYLHQGMSPFVKNDDLIIEESENE